MNLWEYETFNFEILEEDVEELKIRERYYIELNDSIGNGWNERKSYRNKEETKAYHKKYTQENIQEKKEYDRLRRIRLNKKSPKHHKLMIEIKLL